MTITPKRRRKLNQEQHQRQRHKEIKHNSDAMLLGQSGGAPVDASSVEILPEGGGYYTIKVEVPIHITNPPAAAGGAVVAAPDILYCNNTIDISLECKGKYISYENGSKVVCEIISSDRTIPSMGICAITSNTDRRNQQVVIPYTETSITTIPDAPNTVLTNDFSVIGEPVTAVTNYWSFKFDIDKILNRQSGPIYDLIKNSTPDGVSVVSKFVTFVDTDNILLTFMYI